MKNICSFIFLASFVVFFGCGSKAISHSEALQNYNNELDILEACNQEIEDIKKDEERFEATISEAKKQDSWHSDETIRNQAASISEGRKQLKKLLEQKKAEQEENVRNAKAVLDSTRSK